jgi:hypothetical protein
LSEDSVVATLVAIERAMLSGAPPLAVDWAVLIRMDWLVLSEISVERFAETTAEILRVLESATDALVLALSAALRTKLSVFRASVPVEICALIAL